MGRRGGVYLKIPLSHRKMPPCKYWHTRGKGYICASKCITWMRTIMGKPKNIYSSDTIGGQNTANTTSGICRTDQVHRTNTRGPSINGIHRPIRGRLRMSLDERYREPGTHFMDTIMDLRSKIITDYTEKQKARYQFQT